MICNKCDGTGQVDGSKLTRSERQHRYYWVYLKSISEHSGDSISSLHEHFRSRFVEVIEDFVHLSGKEEKVEYQKSTKNLTKDEFTNYIRNIELETEVMAPDPVLFKLKL